MRKAIKDGGLPRIRRPVRILYHIATDQNRLVVIVDRYLTPKKIETICQLIRTNLLQLIQR